MNDNDRRSIEAGLVAMAKYAMDEPETIRQILVDLRKKTRIPVGITFPNAIPDTKFLSVVHSHVESIQRTKLPYLRHFDGIGRTKWVMVTLTTEGKIVNADGKRQFVRGKWAGDLPLVNTHGESYDRADLEDRARHYESDPRNVGTKRFLVLTADEVLSLPDNFMDYGLTADATREDLLRVLAIPPIPEKKVFSDGTVEFYDRMGYLHRADGPALEDKDGTKEWWVNGKLHRIDGPAVEYANGAKEWWVDGNRDRKDGPAIERPYGTKEYWLSGKKVTEEAFRVLHPEAFSSSPGEKKRKAKTPGIG